MRMLIVPAIMPRKISSPERPRTSASASTQGSITAPDEASTPCKSSFQNHGWPCHLPSRRRLGLLFIRAPDSARSVSRVFCATRVAMRHHFCWLQKYRSQGRRVVLGVHGPVVLLECVVIQCYHSETILVTGIILAALVSAN